MEQLDDKWGDDFLGKLNKHYAWPAVYIFKFIVPKEQEETLADLFPQHHVKRKASSQEKYTSITVQMMMPSGDSIIEIYKKASKIKGIIAL